MLKTNRIWAQRSEAIAIIASTPADDRLAFAFAFGQLFNSKPEELLAAADSLREKIVAEKQAELEKAQALAADLEARLEKISGAAPAPAPEDDIAARAQALAAEIDARLEKTA